MLDTRRVILLLATPIFHLRRVRAPSSVARRNSQPPARDPSIITYLLTHRALLPVCGGCLLVRLSTRLSACLRTFPSPLGQPSRESCREVTSGSSRGTSYLSKDPGSSNTTNEPAIIHSNYMYVLRTYSPMPGRGPRVGSLSGGHSWLPSFHVRDPSSAASGFQSQKRLSSHTCRRDTRRARASFSSRRWLRGRVLQQVGKICEVGPPYTVTGTP